jgi:hypothetical protein
MFSSIKTLFRQKEDLFLIERKIPCSYFHNKEKQVNEALIRIWAEELEARYVYKVNEDFIFCIKIEELEYEEIKP